MPLIHGVNPEGRFIVRKLLLAFILLFVGLTIFSCEKEKTVTSTEYIHDIEYIEGPTDTVLMIDTLLRIDTLIQYDTTGVNDIDTVTIIDTVFQTATDTLYITEYIYDTTRIVDTVTITNHIYDTVTVIDTVTNTECLPFVHFAFTCMPVHADPVILDFINTETGYSEGWIYYLSSAQTDMQSPSNGVYDFYGFVNYWTADFTGYYPMEYYWRMSYLSGDPSDPANWELSDPPMRTDGKVGGLKLIEKSAPNISRD
jgi:hypothetical protein